MDKRLFKTDMEDREKTFLVMMQQNGIDFTAEITQEVIDEMQRLREMAG